MFNTTLVTFIYESSLNNSDKSLCWRCKKRRLQSLRRNGRLMGEHKHYSGSRDKCFKLRTISPVCIENICEIEHFELVSVDGTKIARTAVWKHCQHWQGKEIILEHQNPLYNDEWLWDKIGLSNSLNRCVLNRLVERWSFQHLLKRIDVAACNCSIF